MSCDALESRVLRNLENKEKTCYNCNKRGHSKYECRQSPFISNHTEKRHEPDINNVVVIMEGVLLCDLIDLDHLMKHLLKSIKLSKTIKPEDFKLDRPWKHVHRKNDIKITFKTSELKKIFMEAVEGQHQYLDKNVIFHYGSFVNKGFKLKLGKKHYNLVFRDDLPYDLDKLYTKALEIKEEYGLDNVMIGSKGEIVAHKRTFTYFWCKTEKELENLRKTLSKQSNCQQIERKRRILRIGPSDYHKNKF